jgi:hypothetical protein
MFLGKDGWGPGQTFLFIRMNEWQKQNFLNAFG